MRRLGVLIVLLLVLAACDDTNDDNGVSDSPNPTPTPTEQIAEEPEPTPTEPEPTPVEDDVDPTPEQEPTPTEEPDSAEEPGQLEALVDQVVENVVELRGLEKLEELDFAIMSREELAQMLEDETEIEQAEIDLYWIFRLLPDRYVDLRQLLVDAQAADIYGFYDPEEKETYLIADDGELSAMEEVFLAHEIVHALQDQHFDLEQLTAFGSDNDRTMAFRAVIEGDAILTQELYALEYFDQEQLTDYQQEIMAAVQDEEATRAIESLPRYFFDFFAFPYSAGPRYVLQAFDGTFHSVNAVLENPPVSTQQVLNPGGHLDGNVADPVDVELPPVEERLGEQWSLYEDATMGVFDLTILLESNGVDDADAALEEWAGTRIAMYENDGHVLGVLSSRLHTEEGAAVFEDALIQTMAGYDEEDGIWIGDDRYHTIIASGDTVNLKTSTDPDALLDAAAMN